jgi:C1A family cysteine protease
MNKNRVATDNTIDVAFNSWLNTQNKFYSSPAEKTYRRTVFAANYQKVAQMNQIYTHRSEMNKFGDLTEDEFIAKYTGLNYDANAPKNYVHLEQNGDVKPIDWRTKGAVNKIKDQAQCGSCWAFSATSALESAWQIEKGQLFDLSEQQLVDCSRSQGNQGCNGGWMDYAFVYLKAFGGQVQTSDYPYTARDGQCHAQKAQAKVQVNGYNDVPQNNCAQLQNALQSQPVAVAIAANAIMNYRSGVFENGNCGTGLNHGVTAVGLGTEGGKNYYIVRNSWGNWGESGYIRMSADVQTGTGICGICMASSYPNPQKK